MTDLPEMFADEDIDQYCRRTGLDRTRFVQNRSGEWAFLLRMSPVWRKRQLPPLPAGESVSMTSHLFMIHGWDNEPAGCLSGHQLIAYFCWNRLGKRQRLATTGSFFLNTVWMYQRPFAW